MVIIDKETEINEEPDVKVMKTTTRSMTEGVKKKKKNVPPKTSLKNTEIMKKKTPQRTPVSKKIEVEEKILKRSL